MKTISQDAIRAYNHGSTKPFFAMRESFEGGVLERWGNVHTPHGIVEAMTYHKQGCKEWDNTTFEMVLISRKYVLAEQAWYTPRQLTVRAEAFALACVAAEKEAGE